MSNAKEIMVQACCAPCAIACLEQLKEYKIVLIYNGDNMDTEEEFQRRKDAFKLLVEKYGCEFGACGYTHKEFESCEECIRYRLDFIAETAVSNGINLFTSSLTVSPHKDADMINRIGKEVARKHGLTFLELDLKKNNGFAQTVKISKELGMYRQKYCGCGQRG